MRHNPGDLYKIIEDCQEAIYAMLMYTYPYSMNAPRRRYVATYLEHMADARQELLDNGFSGGYI